MFDSLNRSIVHLSSKDLLDESAQRVTPFTGSGLPNPNTKEGYVHIIEQSSFTGYGKVYNRLNMTYLKGLWYLNLGKEGVVDKMMWLQGQMPGTCRQYPYTKLDNRNYRFRSFEHKLAFPPINPKTHPQGLYKVVRMLTGTWGRISLFRACGLPQGAPTSPFFSNIAINSAVLPDEVSGKGVKKLEYADDGLLYGDKAFTVRQTDRMRKAGIYFAHEKCH